ncbi:MAG: hypothetical protein ABIQ95_09875, partial [Bdellovibrionia bacterium]
HTDSSGANVSIRPIDSVGNQEISFPGETPQKDFRSAISNRNPGIMTLQGRGNQGIISSPQLFLVEKKGEFYLATKNPYYFDQKNPIQDLMKKGFQVNTTYITSDMHEAMQREGGFRFHFSLRERFFFNHIDSNNFYDKIKEHIVIHQAGKGLITLPPGQAVFSLSPQFLLKQVQESCQENLMRGYLFEDQPITLDLLADLHKNATEYLTSMGIKLDARNEQQFVDAIKNPKNNNQLPTKPIIFYNQILNEKGIEELKPYFYLPPSLLTQAREQQTGNVFATILGRFPEGTTAEEMVDLLTEKSDTRNSLIQFFKNNPKSMRDITEAAVRSRQKAVEQGTLDKDSVTLQIPIRAPHFALVTDDDLKIDVNLQGKSGVLVAKNGNLTLQSEKTRNHKEGGNFEENVSDQRTLNFQGHLGLRAGKDIETVAVKISADSLQMEAAGNVKDAAIFLDSFEEGHSGNTNETKAQRKAQLTHINVKEDMTVRGHNVVLQGTQVDAGTIQLQAQGGNVSVLGVKEGSEFSKTTKESTGILFWAGEKITSTVHSLVTFVAPQLKARNTVEVEAANQVTLEAPKLEAQETHLKGRQVTFRQGKNISKLSSREKSANPFWMTMDTLEEENENHVQPQIQGQVKIEAEILELEKVKGEVLKYLGKLEYNPDTLKVVHAVLDEMHKRDITSISAPGPALIAAVAIAVSIATSGAGNALLLGVGMNAATLGSIGATMGSVAISSLTAQVTTQLAVGILAQKSPGDILKKAFNASMLKNVVTSTITAGVLYDVPGAHLAAKNTSEILHRMQTAGAQACVGMGANLAFGDQNLGDALKSGGVQFVSQAASGYLSDRIGKNFADRKDFLDRCAHKVAHGVSAAAFGAAGATALGQDAGTAASGAAMGAMISEIVADSLSKPLESDVAAEMDKHEAELGRPLTEHEAKDIWDSKVADISKIARLTGAVSGVMTGHASGVGAANGAAQTAIGNNFEVTLNNHWQGAWQALRARGNMGLGAVGVGAAATLSGPALFVGSAVALGYALHKITNDSDGTNAKSSIETDEVLAPSQSAANAPKSKVRTEPIDIQEKLAMDEAMANPNKTEIMKGQINDPRYKGTHDKVSHTHEHGDGTVTEVHGFRNKATGEGSGFKFKDAPDNAKSRFNNKDKQ